MARLVTLHIDGDRFDITAHIVGSLAIHRPVYRYMTHHPITVVNKGWSVSHVASGGSINRFAPKGNRGASASLSQLKAWALSVQAYDPAAWAEADALPFGPPESRPDLGARLSAALLAEGR